MENGVFNVEDHVVEGVGADQGGVIVFPPEVQEAIDQVDSTLDPLQFSLKLQIPFLFKVLII